MSPVASDGRFYPAAVVDRAKGLASATKTTTGTSTPVAADDVNAIEATLSISAISGAGAALVLSLESTLDGTNWYTVGTFPSQGATGSIGQVLGGNIGSQIRWKWTISGTSPSVTFAVSAAPRRGGRG